MDQSSNVHLEWNKHQATLVSVFDALLDNEKLTDCTVSAEGQHIRAHKIILSACSPYFEELFSKNYETHPILILHDVKFDLVRALIDFIYRGEVSVPQKELSGFLKLSEALQVSGLSGSGFVDDADTEERSGRNAPSVSPETLQSEPASVQHFNSGPNEPEAKTQSFSGCSLTVSSQEGSSMEVDSALKSIPKYSKGVRQPGADQRTGQKAFKEVVTSNLASQRQAVSTLSNPTGGLAVAVSQTSQPISSQLQISCGELTFHSIVSEEDRFPTPETVSTPHNLSGMSANQEEIPLKTKSEFVESKFEIVEVEDEEDDYHDGDSYDYQEKYTNAEDVNKCRRVSEDVACGGNVQTVGMDSLSVPVGSENLSNMMTSSPSVPQHRYVCQNCGKSYLLYYTLQRHLRFYCGKEPQFQCPRCKKRCWRSDDLKVHMATKRCMRHDISFTQVDSMNITQQWS